MAFIHGLESESLVERQHKAVGFPDHRHPGDPGELLVREFQLPVQGVKRIHSGAGFGTDKPPACQERCSFNSSWQMPDVEQRLAALFEKERDPSGFKPPKVMIQSVDLFGFGHVPQVRTEVPGIQITIDVSIINPFKGIGCITGLLDLSGN